MTSGESLVDSVTARHAGIHHDGLPVSGVRFDRIVPGRVDEILQRSKRNAMASRNRRQLGSVDGSVVRGLTGILLSSLLLFHPILMTLLKDGLVGVGSLVLLLRLVSERRLR